MATPWSIPLGGISTRVELAKEYGGSPYSGGITPANKSDNIFVFSDPEAGEEYGYVYDGLSPVDGAFYYTGHGPNGDHTLTDRNRSLHNHQEDGRSVRVFVADGYAPGTKTKKQRYLGEYRVDPTAPFRREPGRGKNGATRAVLVFRLLPVGEVVTANSGKVPIAPESPAATLVPKEVDSTYFFPTAGTESTMAYKNESKLVSDYESFRQTGSKAMQRWAIRVPGESTRLLTDVYDSSTRTLFEVKGNSQRNSIRSAIGQLMDYRRHIPVENVHSALLLPTLPTADLQNLIAHNGFGLVYRDSTGAFKASSVYLDHVRSLLPSRRLSH
jgi:hypothetical protein